MVQPKGPSQQPAGYLSKEIDAMAKGWPSCLRVVAAVALLILEAAKLTLGQDLTIYRYIWTALKDKFITQSVPDIRRKLQKWAIGPESTLENLLKVASSVVYTWDQKEEEIHGDEPPMMIPEPVSRNSSWGHVSLNGTLYTMEPPF